MAFQQIAQLFGLGAPFLAAGLIYALFKFLDKKASGAANRVMTAWLKGERYKQLDLKHAIVDGFDHLYGVPLLSIRSFLRSAILSFLATVFVIMFGWFFLIGQEDPSYIVGGAEIGGLIGPSIIISDYISLFVVRRCLEMSGRSVILSIDPGSCYCKALRKA
jgi:hypothetical protein